MEAAPSVSTRFPPGLVLGGTWRGGRYGTGAKHWAENLAAEENDRGGLEACGVRRTTDTSSGLRPGGQRAATMAEEDICGRLEAASRQRWAAV